MLSERQIACVIAKVNEDINIPLTSEDREAELIEQVISRVEPCVETALNRLFPEIYVKCLKLALNEEIERKERIEQISDKLREELSSPLTVQLNKLIDMPVLPERLEHLVLKVVSNKIITAFVEWIVGEITEEFE